MAQPKTDQPNIVTQENPFKDRSSFFKKVIGIVIALGVAAAILSAFETRVAWIASFCGAFGDGCRETVPYTMMGIPVPWWGIAYYLALGLLYLIRPSWLFFAVMAGCGVEAVLIVIMVKMKFVCVLCAVNFILMAILFFSFFDPKRLSWMLSLGLCFYVFSDALVASPYGAVSDHAALEATSDILAVVDGQKITREEIEQPMTTRLYQMQTKIYRMKEMALDDRINEILLEKDAAQKGITVEALTKALTSKAKAPDDATVSYYYQSRQYRRWGNWTGSEQQIKLKIRQYLILSAENDEILNHCEQLRQTFPVTVHLEKPPLPMTRVVIEGCPSTGPSHAPVMVVELSDYLCPACRRGHETVKRIRETYKDQIKWVFKDNPLESIHAGAKKLALSARCAREQGKFWEFHDLLFSGEKPAFEDALAYARKLNLDLARLNECTADPKELEKLDQELEGVRQAGITSTPTLIINGELHVGVPSFEELCRLIDQALAAGMKDEG